MVNRITNAFVAIFCISLSGCWYFSSEFGELQKAKIYSVSEDKKAVILDGVVNSSAFEEMEAILTKNPKIRTLKIKNCYGSIDDDVNLKLGRYIY